MNEAEEPSPVALDRGGIAAEAGGMYVLREGKELDWSPLESWRRERGQRRSLDFLLGDKKWWWGRQPRGCWCGEVS